MSFNDLVVWANQPFPSDAELIAAMSSPRYSDPHDQAYRDAVEMKIALTETMKESAGITEPTRIGPNTVSVEGGEMKVQPRAGKMTLYMTTGGEGPTLQEEAALQEKRSLPAFTKPTGPVKPA